jgi:hypothetical protein
MRLQYKSILWVSVKFLHQACVDQGRGQGRGTPPLAPALVNARKKMTATRILLVCEILGEPEYAIARINRKRR